jgi:hypothetical protein
MVVASQGRADVEHSLLEVCFLTQFGFVGTLASGRTATVAIGDARDFGKKSESSAATRIAPRRIP